MGSQSTEKHYFSRKRHISKLWWAKIRTKLQLVLENVNLKFRHREKFVPRATALHHTLISRIDGLSMPNLQECFWDYQVMLPAKFVHDCSTRKRDTFEKVLKVTVLCHAVKMDHELVQRQGYVAPKQFFRYSIFSFVQF